MKQTTRRGFLAASAAAGMTPLMRMSNQAAEPGEGGRECYELRRYEIETEDQKREFERFARDAAIPALNRLGIRPVGVFYPREGLSPIYVLLPFPSLEAVANVNSRLGIDQEFLEKGNAFINAPAERPAYKRYESSLMIAFKGMPKLETPVRSPGRVFQLRIYESPSALTGQKKIEMFNDAGEIAIFREVELRPVFFGETLIGSKMPNLTYMLAFESEAELKANWNRFRTNPKWQKLRAMPEYADKKIVSGITSIILAPADYSQI